MVIVAFILCPVNTNVSDTRPDEVLTGQQWVLEATEGQQWISNQTNNDAKKTMMHNWLTLNPGDDLRHRGVKDDQGVAKAPLI